MEPQQRLIWSVGNWNGWKKFCDKIAYFIKLKKKLLAFRMSSQDLSRRVYWELFLCKRFAWFSSIFVNVVFAKRGGNDALLFQFWSASGTSLVSWAGNLFRRSLWILKNWFDAANFSCLATLHSLVGSENFSIDKNETWWNLWLKHNIPSWKQIKIGL